MAVEIDGTSKGLLGAFAVFALGSGIASLVYGVLLLLQYIPIEFNYGNFNIFSTSILFIVVGGLLIITVLLGIIGALKDLSNLRLVTLVLLFILFAILAAVGIWGMVSVKTGRLQTSINEEIENFKNVKNDGTTPELQKKSDYLHKRYNCCSAYEEYNTRVSGVTIPESCLAPESSVPISSKHFEKGCAGVYFAMKVKTVFHLAILALVAAGLVLLALVLYAVVSQRARAGYAAVSRG